MNNHCRPKRGNSSSLKVLLNKHFNSFYGSNDLS